MTTAFSEQPTAYIGGVRLPVKLAKAVRREAARRNMSVSEYVGRILDVVVFNREVHIVSVRDATEG